MSAFEAKREVPPSRDPQVRGFAKRVPHHLVRHLPTSPDRSICPRDLKPRCAARLRGDAKARLSCAAQKIENSGVELPRLFKLRKMAAFVEQDRSRLRQLRFDNAGVIRRHKPVLPSPDNQGWLVDCAHDGLQGRDLFDPKSAGRD